MTTATATRSAGFSVRSAQATKRASTFSLDAFFSVVSQSLAMAHAVPNAGRISEKQLAKVRAIAAAM